ncbi:hypothetical protein [Rhodococcus tibetensis]|uniref:DUF805 domain-containing protein n=1 Tax=Rhodococcus tibetensis TaxID=2965064 RepID=A0ABT1QCH5_9NOCA|nr:hypothetical protein [Rhodococcus sp. FXJ9.536]MCQ4119897.1 hypothetical protein [Rhodococcus sp. FXJ9.536]
MPDRVMRAVWSRLHGDRFTRPLTRRINGHRGKFLLLFAMIYALFGYSYVMAGITATRRATFGWLPDWFSFTVLAWPWFIAAGVAVVSAILYDPPRTDRHGFMALAVVPMVWGFMYLISWLAGFATTGWISAIIYFGFSAIVTHASSWPNAIQLGGDRLLPKHTEPEDD